MILTRTPVRIPLGGGGTDLPEYCSRHGCSLVGTAIDKYIYLMVNKRFENTIRVSYSETEIVKRVDDIRHPLVREVLKLLDIDRGIEIVSVADIPSNTGLGSSSAFTVGLLNALHTYKREQVTAETLAEEASRIEIDILGEPIGKQDQYLSALGGITCLDIDTRGAVSTKQLMLSNDTLDQLESNTLAFYTGARRRASDVLTDQQKELSCEDSQANGAMHTIKQIGIQIRSAMQQSDLYSFGELLDKHWQAKKKVSSKITFGEIDKWYELGKKSGALGGKLMGAGGGGFLMFYCDNGKSKLRDSMAREGLAEMRFRVDFDGTKVVANL